MRFQTFMLGGLLAASPSLVHAGCCVDHEAQESFRQADAVAEYRILSRENVDNGEGPIFTRYTAQLNETLKGVAPTQLGFKTPGGRRGRVIEFSSLGLDLAEGIDYILHLQHAADGSWSPLPFLTLRNQGTVAEKKALRSYFRSGAKGRLPRTLSGPVTQEDFSGIPGSVVTPTGYLEQSFNGTGQPARFATCDGGIAIPYLVDIDPAKLPPGMTPAQALAAVEEAFGAWAEASSLTFRFEGTQSFGAAAGTISGKDGRLRIQLHDTYNVLSGTTLGVAGGSRTVASAVFCGGKLGAQGFQELLDGFVVLEHDAAFMDTAAGFTHVLTHEIGHALGLAHSSGNDSEPDAILKNATMYYKASNDGRGAGLTIYDEDRIAFGYPATNTPPYTPDRIIRAVCRNSTSATFPTEVGVNRLQLRAYDRQGGALTPMLDPSSPGTMTLSPDGQLAYTAMDFAPAARLSDAQIQNGSSYGLPAYVQFSDGVNLSRAARCAVIEILSDNRPADGLPNSWLTTYFGNTLPGGVSEDGVYDDRHPNADPDGDGLTNRTEFFYNTNPIDPASPPPAMSYDHAARTLTFTPQRFAPYRIQASTGLSGWSTRALSATTYGTPAPLPFDTAADGSAPRMFYRALLAP